MLTDRLYRLNPNMLVHSSTWLLHIATFKITMRQVDAIYKAIKFKSSCDAGMELPQNISNRIRKMGFDAVNIISRFATIS